MLRPYGRETVANAAKRISGVKCEGQAVKTCGAAGGSR